MRQLHHRPRGDLSIASITGKCAGGANRRHISALGIQVNTNLMTAAIQMRRATYHLRSASIADEAFLLELYAQTRADELIHSGMDALQHEVFVQMQFRLRQASYRTTYPMAVDEIICADSGNPIGRVLVDRAAGGLCLVDIAIVAEKQRQGFGTQVIQQLQRECTEQDWKMRLQVLKGSAAERLYRRLGFRAVDEDRLRTQMAWNGTKV